MYFNTPLETVLFFDEVLEVAAILTGFPGCPVACYLALHRKIYLPDLLELSPEFPSGLVGTTGRMTVWGIL